MNFEKVSNVFFNRMKKIFWKHFEKKIPTEEKIEIILGKNSKI